MTRVWDWTRRVARYITFHKTNTVFCCDSASLSYVICSWVDMYDIFTHIHCGCFIHRNCGDLAIASSVNEVTLKDLCKTQTTTRKTKHEIWSLVFFYFINPTEQGPPIFFRRIYLSNANTPIPSKCSNLSKLRENVNFTTTRKSFQPKVKPVYTEHIMIVCWPLHVPNSI